MSKAEIAGKIRDFIEEAFPQQGVRLEDSTDLLEDWFVDSFGIIETVMFLEKAFGMNVGRADIQARNFKNIDTLSTFVFSRTAPQEQT